MKKANELTIYGILAMSKRYTTLPTRTRFFILSAGKIEKFLSSCFFSDGSHVKIVWLYVAVLCKHDILRSWDNVHLFNIIQWKVSQNYFNLFNYSNQTCAQVSKFSFALDKATNSCKDGWNLRSGSNVPKILH